MHIASSLRPNHHRQTSSLLSLGCSLAHSVDRAAQMVNF